ncbi:hypothetical protein BDY19DRAFT_901160 [Irpex rosettiformis]|uniref:Uncharacterized protein n=2 Tax=Irpex rosettiformis TaxID=378272 RepID=A0ACB8TLU1_9APHY|nr:hypothetical protein BDY19DRAFT_901167 [Irpex rosettiformis]KAI0082975.1 hypothetical protein BDY19DRAFT_901160 [Irpex rosettiformis]
MRSLPFNCVLEAIKSQGFKSLGHFLVELFTLGSSRDSKSKSLSQSVSSFLNGRTGDYDVIALVNILYESRFSFPKKMRTSITPNEDKHRPDETRMARYKLEKWAISVVEGVLDKEAERLVSPESSLRLSGKMTWDFATGFSFHDAAETARKIGPTCVHATNNSSSNTHPSPGISNLGGRTKSRRDPLIIVMATLMMLLNARNLCFTAFQKLIGVWLFANSASRGIYDVLGRIGLSVSNYTVHKVLRQLSESAQNSIRLSAILRNFLFAYDNLNRQRRVYDGELGETDTMDSGTAAAFVVIEDCDSQVAFDARILHAARARRERDQLSVEVLKKRVDWTGLRDVMAVHVAFFLTQHVSRLSTLQKDLNSRLRTRLAKHRMRDGRRTQIYPLASSEHDEGSTRGNRDVIDDVMLKQLGLEKEELDAILTIVTGDQSTIEKIRNLKKLLDSCPHGYDRYGWALPLIQLWHMGWADLERILATHWGLTNGSESDISTFSFINELLRRKVKNVRRPDYYPAQALVFDNLRMEVIDCWQYVDEHYRTDNLEQHFEDHPEACTLDYVLAHAEEIVKTYLTTRSAEHASKTPNTAGLFPNGQPWVSPFEGDTAPVLPIGDDVLANTILCMRDSMLHYEFHSAIADGDIGRAMNVMAVWAFTFCGSGKSKYTNELLELTCNFEYEYSDELKRAVLNNWLCNLTGQTGRWFPMDLMMEHNINLLKRMSGQRDIPFTATFFKEVISLNIRYFLEVKESLRMAVGLGYQGGKHAKKKKQVAMKHLRRTMQEHQLHRFRRQRTYGFKAQDDFAEGLDRFTSTTRISDFVKRTLADDGDLNGDDDNEENEPLEPGEERHWSNMQVPLPNIWQDGELVSTDVNDDGDGDSDEESDGIELVM